MKAKHLPTAALLLVAAPALGHGPGCLSDPVVTHTNGMRLASTTSFRSHNVYWRPDPYHLGYCDGRLYSPCRNDWREIGTRHWGRYCPPTTPLGPTARHAPHAPDGLENLTGESLGVLAADGVRPIPEAPSRPAPPAAPAGAGWYDAIETLGRQMMTTPDG